VNPSDPAGPAAFAPQDGGPGQPLEAWDGDTVTWNNTTGDHHWPWPTDANYQPLNVVRYLSTLRGALHIGVQSGPLSGVGTGLSR